ncbi:hypothetical protein [Sulfurovum sp.]|uniref:hypothetical protein n=1 Tax=Sulfurovum sp. TaxID=1969726 RepID=UPI0035643C5C
MTYNIYIGIAIVIAFVLAKFLTNQKNLPLTKAKNINEYDIHGTKVYCQINVDNVVTGKVSSILLVVKSTSNARFSVRQKSVLEKLLLRFKWLTAFASGNKKFDDLVYVASDQSEVHDLLKDQKTQECILELFEKAPLYPTKHIEITNENNEFLLKLTLVKKLRKKKIDIDKVLDRYAEPFLDLHKSINFDSIVSTDETLRAFTQKMKFFLIFTTILSFFFFMAEFYVIYPSTIDFAELLFVTLLTSTLFALMVISYVFTRLDKSSFKLDMGIKYFLWSIAASFIVVFSGIKYLNTALDDSTPVVITDTIKSKHKHISRAPRKYFFDLKNETSFLSNDIRIHRELYDSKSVGSTVDIYIKQGLLNIRWIEHAE